MEKENKLATEQETKDNKIVELKDENLETISAGSENQDLTPFKNDELTPPISPFP